MIDTVCVRDADYEQEQGNDEQEEQDDDEDLQD